MTPMNDDDRLQQLVRLAIPPVAAGRPSRDLWPAITSHGSAPLRWSRIDLGLAAAAAIALLRFPDWLWLLAYHL